MDELDDNHLGSRLENDHKWLVRLGMRVKSHSDSHKIRLTVHPNFIREKDMLIGLCFQAFWPMF